MGWSKRWRIDSSEKLERILSAIGAWSLDFSRHPFEIVFREERVEKTHGDRKLFHAACSDLAPHWGLTPGETKIKVKEDFYGVDMVIAPGRLSDEEVVEFRRLLAKIGPYQVTVQSSEDSDQPEYRRLIDHLYQMAAEQGLEIGDRRTR